MKEEDGQYIMAPECRKEWGGRIEEAISLYEELGGVTSDEQDLAVSAQSESVSPGRLKRPSNREALVKVRRIKEHIKAATALTQELVRETDVMEAVALQNSLGFAQDDASQVEEELT